MIPIHTKRDCTRACCQGIQAPTKDFELGDPFKLFTKSDKRMSGVSVIAITFSHDIMFPAHIHSCPEADMEAQELPFVKALTVRPFPCSNASGLNSVGKSSDITGLAYGWPAPTRVSTIPPPFVKT